MPQPSMLDRILEIVQRIGPVLPVDVASKLGLDSFLASAFLSQLAEAGKIQVSKERVGGSQLFFVPGQENSAQEKVKALMEASKKTARTFAKSVPDNPEVQKKRDAFAAKLQEIESKEKDAKKRQSKIVEPFATMQPGHKVIPITIKHVSQEVGPIPERAVGGLMMPRTEEQRRTEARRTERPESLEKPKPEIPKVAKMEEIKPAEEPKPAPEVEEVRYEAPKLEVKEEIAPVEELKPEGAESEDSASLAKPEKSSGIREAIEKKFLKKPAPPLEPSPLVDAAMAMLVDAGCEIIGTDLLKKGKDANIIFDLPTKIGNIKILACVRSKKSITEADLSMAYTEKEHRKLPYVVFITDGRMTKNAQSYHKVISDSLKFKQVESK
ncbi:MAG: hypothetical protein V1839_00765 [archaeon]